jgi:DNA-binding LacI/PurR family transcriptional regulator
MGTRMLLQLIDGEELDMLRVELSTSLVVRSSTAKPKPEGG